MHTSRAGYSRLRTTPPDDDWTQDQFRKPKTSTPVKEIRFAALLLCGGIVLLALGLALQLGYIIIENEGQGGVPLIMLGLLLFVPGFYHVRIAYYAHKGYPGYRFEDIPRFEHN